MNKNQILLVNDLPGVGRVALSAAIPIFSAMGFSIQTLPTSIVSNTLDFGEFEILDTTDYMEKAVKVWKNLGFHFDCISTGFMATHKQVDIVKKLIDDNANEDPFVVVDPIMGDNGILYNGINTDRIDVMSALCKYGNIVTPNVTEALMLAGSVDNQPLSLSKSECIDLIDAMRDICRKSIAITSAVIKGEEFSHAIIGWDHEKKDYFFLPYEHIKAHFPGTGDVFTSIMTGKYLRGMSLTDSLRVASNFVGTLLQGPQVSTDTRAGLFIEKFLDRLK